MTLRTNPLNLTAAAVPTLLFGAFMAWLMLDPVYWGGDLFPCPGWACPVLRVGGGAGMAATAWTSIRLVLIAALGSSLVIDGRGITFPGTWRRRHVALSDVVSVAPNRHWRKIMVDVGLASGRTVSLGLWMFRDRPAVKVVVDEIRALIVEDRSSGRPP